MLASLSPSTIKQYDVSLKKWWFFCISNQIDMFKASVPNVIYFLTELFKNGSQYGTLNSVRSALSLIIGPSIAKDDRIHRFFKGVFRLRTPHPKYNTTWDTNCVLNYVSSWFPNETLTLDKLSIKTVTLLALATAHRIQTISKINIKNIEIESNRITIKIPDLIKTSRIGAKQPILFLPFFRDKQSICPAQTLVCYLERTRDVRKSDYLFLAFKKPNGPVGTQTLSRWIKRCLCESGIDTSIFSAHSTRHAATSRARSLGVNIDAIRNTAGWSGNSTTFATFYNRTILNNEPSSLARAIINNL
jgi:hypothetical protein